MTFEYIWILTESVINYQIYNNFKFTEFPIGSLGKQQKNGLDLFIFESDY